LNVKNRLDALIANGIYEISEERPDPIIIAKRHKNEFAALCAALFAYGNVKAIMKFLNSLDLENFESNGSYYRFQTQKDVEEFLKTVKTIKKNESLEDVFMKGFKKNENPLEGIASLIKAFRKANDYDSPGYAFLLGKIPPNKTKGVSPYKRWNMFLRWMIRDSKPDLGMWKNAKKNRLIIPLDTHTHKVSLKLGLLRRKTYDLESAILLTEKLKTFDENDPLKYDFALYRIGQLNINA
jgi:uncharacterized protein (TIGR02757 family)